MLPLKKCKLGAMTVERLLVDTNVLVYHLGGRAAATKALQGAEVHISFVTEIELQSKASLTASDLGLIQAAMVNYRISDVNPSIKRIAGQLRRQHGLKLADALIAATALHLNIPLLTADGGFERLKELMEIRSL
ncbi:MAG: type II toxin-antitoxin system VapC family toxin [Flavobacteriales bacterium]|nr:type II toxin-antitoxin system VapC family toxin [Flavobacteriales bacterium]